MSDFPCLLIRIEPQVTRVAHSCIAYVLSTGQYLWSPILTHHTIPACQQQVSGIAVLADEVFLVRQVLDGVSGYSYVYTSELTAPEEGRPRIEVYDADTLTLQRHVDVNGLAEPWDMTSCARYECLYVSDQGHNGSVHRVTPDGREAATRWTVNDTPYGLSVTSDSFNVLVACPRTRQVKEYDTRGNRVRAVTLQPDVLSSWHAVLSGGRFVVCHGGRSDPLHRVCVVDDDGTVTRSYGGAPGSANGQTSWPVRLAVDRRGYVLVADFNNKRILLLSRSLSEARELVSERDVGRSMRPMRLCLDEFRGRLYVTDEMDKDVLVFQLNVRSV